MTDAATTSTARSTDRLRALLHRAFVAPRPAWPLAIARVLLGVAILGWAVTMTVDVSTFLSDDGLVPTANAHTGWRWIPLDSPSSARLALAALVGASIAIIIGWRPTVWLVVAFALLVAIQRRNPYITNSGDLVLRDLALLLAFCPTGAALSVDRIRRDGRRAFFTSALVAPWGTRLVQLQMMVVYLFAVRSKNGSSWSDGSAVSTAFRLDDLQRFGPVQILIDNVTVVALITWSTLIVELALGTLLWSKRLRPALIVLGVLLHLTIDASMLVGFFGLAMIAGLMTFLDADWIERVAQRRRQRVDAGPGTVGADADETSASALSLNPISAPPLGASVTQTFPP